MINDVCGYSRTISETVSFQKVSTLIFFSFLCGVNTRMQPVLTYMTNYTTHNLRDTNYP